MSLEEQLNFMSHEHLSIRQISSPRLTHTHKQMAPRLLWFDRDILMSMVYTSYARSPMLIISAPDKDIVSGWLPMGFMSPAQNNVLPCIIRPLPEISSRNLLVAYIGSLALISCHLFRLSPTTTSHLSSLHKACYYVSHEKAQITQEHFQPK